MIQDKIRRELLLELILRPEKTPYVLWLLNHL
jgi:hypothetical protein